VDYRDSHRQLQDRYDTRRLADRLAQTAGDAVAPFRDFIEARDMFFIATADASGQPQCSYKGGDPGFVRVIDETTIAFPVYDGNGMFLSLGNIRGQARVGMLFVDFETPNRLRLNGIATVDEDDPLLASFSGALLVVRVRTTHVFPNCGRYIHKMQLVERSAFVPRAAGEVPVPDWKRMTWAQEYLPDDDPAREAPPIA
jgi:uncharacterized protein